MKKKFLAATALLALTFSLTACGSFKCDLCGKESSGSKHKISILGVEGTVCDDCYAGYSVGSEIMDGLLGD